MSITNSPLQQPASLPRDSCGGRLSEFDSELLAVVVTTVAQATFSTLLYLIPVAARQRTEGLFGAKPLQKSRPNVGTAWRGIAAQQEFAMARQRS